MKRLLTRALVLATLAMAGLVAPAAPASAAPDLTVTARNVLLGDTPQSLVLVGKYTCGPYPGGAPERGIIDLGVEQVVNGVTVTGNGYLEPVTCTGEPQWYVAELTAYTGSFVQGRARWSASGYLEWPGGFDNVYVPPTSIRIRPAV